MALTPQSTYQSASQQHNAGVPPDCDAQRASENYNSYVVRMQGHSLLPDILPTEDDVTYQKRVGIIPSVLNLTGQVWGYVSMTGATQYTATTVGCTISRSAVGTYPITFNTPLNTSGYLVLFEGQSGSNALATESIAYGINATTTGVTMSVSNIDKPLVLQDFTTGSFSIKE
jgi:hypothetical protein